MQKVELGTRLRLKNNAAYFKVIDYTMGDYFIKCEVTGEVINIDYLRLLNKFEVQK